ncbi:MAG: hypothetical protein ABFR75_10630 [Acidobacteriota bacterium]
MKKFSQLRIILLVAAALSIISCQHKTTAGNINIFPPETAVVSENGSMPPGLRTTLEAANIKPGCITCNSQNRYSSELKPFSKVSAKSLKQKLDPYLNEKSGIEKKSFLDMLEDHIMWAMVRGVLIEANNNNFGAIVLKGFYWKDKNGVKHPLTIFRTAFTPDPAGKDSCYSSILDKGKVKHVINLYDGEMEMNDLIKAERETAQKHGASYVKTGDLNYGHWRAAIREFPNPGHEREIAKKNLGKLIREQILNPGGKSPEGNILIHCGGGMHRTGMVIGILQKIFNGRSMDHIKKVYGYHTGYRGKDRPGGFEQGNLDLIEEFEEKYIKE